MKKVYVARDREGGLYLHLSKPFKSRWWWHSQRGKIIEIPDDFLSPDINPQWTDTEPIEVEISINIVKK